MGERWEEHQGEGGKHRGDARRGLLIPTDRFWGECVPILS